MMRDVYRVHDRKANTWGGLVEMHNRAVAERDFRRLANDRETEVGRNPEDFSLWYVGQVEAGKPDLIPADPECILQAISLQEGNN